MNMNLDVKLQLSPIVVLHKLPEEELLSEKITREAPSEEEKINFLSYFGLVRKSWDASLPSTSKESEPIHSRRKRFCCAGFAKTQRRKSNHQISEMCMLSHPIMRLNPRVCVKKWLGGENIKVSKHKYRELEESLIPKTHNHYSCKETPKKPLPSNTNSEPVHVEVSVVEEYPCLAVPHNEDEKSKENWNSHCSREVNCHVLRSGENIFSPYQIPSTNLPVRYSTSKDQHFHQKPLEKKNGIGTILKEVRVCLERWEGEGCIVLPKKMNGMENYCARPKGNRKCCQSR